jgi:hypothetical protein
MNTAINHIRAGASASMDATHARALDDFQARQLTVGLRSPSLKPTDTVE